MRVLFQRLDFLLEFSKTFLLELEFGEFIHGDLSQVNGMRSSNRSCLADVYSATPYLFLQLSKSLEERVIHGLSQGRPPNSGTYLDVTQIGELQARSCITGLISGRGVTPARMASQVDQRQVGFCNARA